MDVIDLTPIFQAVIGLIVALLSVFVVPLLHKKAEAFDATELETWVRLAVAAAEQLFKTTQGRAKKQYVLEYLYRKGYDINAEDVQNAIEAAVLKLHAELYGAEKMQEGGKENEQQEK